MRHRFAIVLGLGLGAHFLSAGCSGTSGLTCDDLRTPCGDGGPTTVDDASLVGDGAQGPDANVTPGDDGASEASSNDDSGFDSGPLCGTLTDCEEAGCVDTTSSVDNCGACGKVCPGASNGGATCTASTCSIGCDTGFTDCSGTCANEQTDPKHCGSCTACPVPANGTATCASAKCGISCNAGYENCGGACVGPDDPAHCGASCTVCAGPASGNGNATCATGSCGIACNAGWFQCNGDCHSETAPPTDSCTVTSAFAVFVSTTGTDAPSSGTPTAPYATIGYAVAHAKSLSRVYVCGGNYTGAVSVGSGAPALTIYGGFNCSSLTAWTYDPAHQQVKVQPIGGVSALTVGGVTSAMTFENIEFDSANATSAGASSIAAVVSGSTGAIAFVSCTFNAGSGSPGAQGSTPTTPLPTATAGNPAATASNAGGPTTNACVCPNGVSSYGGGGGNGGASPQSGGSGQPQLSTNAGAAGGPAVICGNGTKGDDALGVADGSGATAVGSVVASAWVPASGTTGTSGGTGQGGGGGGGTYNLLPTSVGNGGSGGGCGGCGGGGGGPGSGGGASIGALIVQSPSVAFTSCTVKTAGGGAGGAGAAGQGGAPGAGPGASTNGCPGGTGGSGGKAGAGGGAAGGVSAGVAWHGSAPTVDSATTGATSLGPVGPKGNGGNPGANDGIAGTAGAVLPL